MVSDADAVGDLNQVEWLCRRCSIADHDVDELRPLVDQLLHRYWDAVERVAASLLQHGHLSAAAIDAAMRPSEAK